MGSLEKAVSKMPKFMHPDYSLISNFDDLLFQIGHEIDLAEEGDLDPIWTTKQLHAAKIYAANVKIASLGIRAECAVCGCKVRNSDHVGTSSSALCRKCQKEGYCSE